MHLLGIHVSSDMKWDTHFENVLKKARKRIFVLCNLRRSGCPSILIFRTYCALLRSVLLYAYPAFCNAPRRLIDKFKRFERRCFKIIGSKALPPLEEVGKTSARALFKEVEGHLNHPLREIFRFKPESRTRRTTNLLPYT